VWGFREDSSGSGWLCDFIHKLMNFRVSKKWQLFRIVQ
jgi:hypothetical protein